MKRNRSTVAGGMLAVMGVCLAYPALVQTAPPQGAAPAPAAACTAPPSWFRHHDQTPEPDAAAFPASPSNCDFHLWAWQEFLWLTHRGSDGRLRFIDFPTPADAFAPGVDLPAFAAVPKGRRLKLRPRVNKPVGASDLSTINQAGSKGILVAPNGRVVYYSTFVNQTYYDFIRQNQFNVPANIFKAPPTLNFPVGSLELKASWMILGAEETGQGYYTTTADVELLENSSKGIVVNPSNVATVKVAFLGLHVVGVVQNHPEFIWATFENNANSPDLPPNVQPGASTPVSSQNFSLYTANTSAVACNTFDADKLTLDQATQVLSPVTQVFREYDLTGAPLDPTNGPNIQSLNASVQQQLGSDPFANYRLIGGLWMAANNGLKPGMDTIAPQAGSVTGTDRDKVFGGLANSTMETFSQSLNCFVCHNTGTAEPPAGFKGVSLPAKNLNLSHILTDAYFQNSQAAITGKAIPK